MEEIIEVFYRVFRQVCDEKDAEIEELKKEIRSLKERAGENEEI